MENLLIPPFLRVTAAAAAAAAGKEGIPVFWLTANVWMSCMVISDVSYFPRCESVREKVLFINTNTTSTDDKRIDLKANFKLLLCSTGKNDSALCQIISCTCRSSPTVVAALHHPSMLLCQHYSQHEIFHVLIKVLGLIWKLWTRIRMKLRT